jgi:hypothetical protein
MPRIRMPMRERAVQAVLAVVLWWAVYWRVELTYGEGGGIIAATCAAWGFVLLCAWAAYLLGQRAAGGDQHGGPRPPSPRWPGASP